MTSARETILACRGRTASVEVSILAKLVKLGGQVQAVSKGSPCCPQGYLQRSWTNASEDCKETAPSGPAAGDEDSHLGQSIESELGR